jgi:hypothetical protein|tara:strand:- start:488 stop:667 length:180 start_codon:yes stop_codon:yes gene_type:complete
MAFHTTIVPAPSGQPDARYTETYLEDFINTTVVPASGATIVQILENRGSNLIIVWDDSL